MVYSLPCLNYVIRVINEHFYMFALFLILAVLLGTCRMYEDRFGTEDDPVVVPSLEPERIIGVTDPDDENLVVWGILRESDPPRQFIEGGEFYVLKKVPYVRKVGDVLDEIEAMH